MIVDPHTGYATRWYRADPRRRPREWWWKSIVVDTPEEEIATTGLFPVEDNKFTVTMAGVGGKYPPSEAVSFTQKLAGLRSPIIAEEVALAQPISPVYSYRNMANRWRRYDKWKGALSGFVALGDSTCAFNPVYGQGMTSCAVGALILGEMIEQMRCRGSRTTAKIFFRAGGVPVGTVGTRYRRGFSILHDRRGTTRAQPAACSGVREAVGDSAPRRRPARADHRRNQHGAAAVRAVHAVESCSNRACDGEGQDAR